VNDDQQPEFRSLTEFYIVIFLNHLKIVENPPKERENLKIRMAMANAMENNGCTRLAAASDKDYHITMYAIYLITLPYMLYI
jgi:hypothetical protein